LARIRTGARRRQLDAALAEGADPWSAGDVFVRASRLGSWSERRKVAGGLRELVALATHQQPASPYLKVRHRAVLEQRDSLLALADRLGHPAPVEVSVVAQLALLLSDGSSPVYVGGKDPSGLADVTTRCVLTLWGEEASD
jgi:hypothetical protein